MIRFCSSQIKGKYIVQEDMKFLSMAVLQRDFRLLIFLELKKMNGSIRLFQLQSSRMIGILFFTTKHGISKRSPLSSFANIRNNGLIAVNLREDDELISVRLTDGHKENDYWYKKWIVDSFP